MDVTSISYNRMKKSVLFFLCGIAAVGMLHAQTALMGTRGTDNWSVGWRLGGTTPLTHSAFFGGMRPAMGLELSKQLTTGFGMTLQGMGYINTTPSATAIDVTDVALLGRFYLQNMVLGYRGMPRPFEWTPLVGLGWMHHYRAYAADRNDLSGRMGVDFLFHLDSDRRWTLGIRPMLVYNLTGDHPAAKVRLNAHQAAWEWTAGLTYHFRGSNQERFFTWVPVLDIVEREELNDEVNRLRQVVQQQSKELQESAGQMGWMMSELDECRDRLTQTDELGMPVSMPVASVIFRRSQTAIDDAQRAQVERVAQILQARPNCRLIIQGYASPEGAEEYNLWLSQARADAVKQLLVTEYGIEPERIEAQGLGVGDLFSQPRWNRTTLCMVEE